MLFTKYKYVCALFVAVVLAVAVFAPRHDDATLAQLDSARLDAATAQMTARQLRASAEMSDSLAVLALHRADSLSRRAVVTRERIHEIAVVTHDTIAILADSALAQSDTVEASLRSALQSSQDAAHGYKTALDTTQAALTRLRAAAGVVIATQRGSRFARFIPHPGIGVVAGVDALGAPHLIVGVSFGWQF